MAHETRTQRPEHEQPPSRERGQWQPATDEIDLGDLLAATWRRRWWFLGVFAIVFVLSVAYAFLAPPKYNFRAILEIGSIWNPKKGELVPIEPAQNIKDRIKRLYIPAILYQHREHYEGHLSPQSFNVEIPDESGVAILSRKAPADATKLNIGLLTKIIDRVRAHHKKLFNVSMSQQQKALAAARNELKTLQSEERLIRADLERIKERKKVLTEEIASLTTGIERMVAQRKSVLETASADQKAMTLLLINSQIQAMKQRLANLEEQLAVGLAESRDQLEKRLADNLLAQATKREKIAARKARIAAMQPTQVVVPPSRSLNPVSPNKTLVIGVGFILATLLGLLAVAIHALVGQARRRLAEEPKQL